MLFFGSNIPVTSLACTILFSVAPALKLRAEPTAYFYAGNFKHLCASVDARELELCEGFIGATLEIVTNNRIYGIHACVPPRTSLGAAVRISKRWFDTHPEEGTQAASLAVARAMAAAFPCK